MSRMDEIQLELNELRNKYNSTINENTKLDIKRKMTELNKEFIPRLQRSAALWMSFRRNR